MVRKVVLSILVILTVALLGHAPAQAKVERRGDWLYVDGEPFLVKGVGYSPYRPGQAPWSGQIRNDVMATDFAMIKQAGFNTIRTWRPLTLEQLALAKKQGLMVLQGIWIDPNGNLGTETFRDAAVDIVRREVERIKGHDEVLTVVVGNELDPSKVVQAGVSQTETLLRAMAQTVKDTDPTRLVSYANWPWLSSLDASMWDVVSFNVYPYEPVNVSHSFGYRGYLQHLKRTVARGKPLLITELGMSVSPKPGAKSGYGGLNAEQQAKEVLKLWDGAFESGAQGACVFEWNDEWWKRGDHAEDAAAHDPDDPEEWFGMTEFDSVWLKGSAGVAHASDVPQQLTATPRPVYNALRAYNHAVLVSPSGGTTYRDRLPISVYTTDAVTAVRVRAGNGKWLDAAQVSPHWWRAQVALPSSEQVKPLRVAMEARNAKGKVLVQRERVVEVGPVGPNVAIDITTDHDLYDVTDAKQSLHATIVVTSDGKPMGSQPVMLSIIEPASKFELTHIKQTDQDGKIVLDYPVWDPGVVTVSAATAPDRDQPERRLGAEHSVSVQRRLVEPKEQQLVHVPSPWEARMTDEVRAAIHPKPAFRLYDPGTEAIVDYAKYGTFHGVGTPEYRYEITDQEGLSAAVGEGVYPNEDGLFKDPSFAHALREDRLKGSLWDFTYHKDMQIAFLRWASTDEEAPGVKQFFVALTLERAGLFQQAVKAYYAILVHFPNAVSWTEFKTPWYIGKVAQDKIEAILRLHPELSMRLENAHMLVDHGFDNDIDNDVIYPNPGQLVAVKPEDVNPPTIDLSKVAIKRETGKGRIRLRQYVNGHWQLMVDGKPWVIRGISYQPSAVGESPDEGTLKDWMIADRNGNGKPDGPYDTFVDANRNNKQDPDEPTVGDFQLLKEMGVNTMRLYHHASNKALLRQLYEQHGIMVLMGDLVGMYTVGSGAKWEEGTNYHDPVQRKRMSESVKQMVREFKKEPYILMWVLGNENNYGGVHGIIGGVGNAAQYPQEYYSFLNELATWIHKEDPYHPVALANGEWLFIDLIGKVAPAIDVFGANVYRGSHGFGRSFFDAAQRQLGKPVLVTEYGCPAYQADEPLDVGEMGQALYHMGNWVDLEDNLAGRGIGNALGGVVFAWVDEWWKAGQPPRFSPNVQETVPNWSGPFPGGKNYEEWLGITSQGDGTLSPYLRQLRKAYQLYQRMWTR